MATYIPITDTQIDPDAPVTSQLMYQMRENPIAISEGAAGAPRNVGLSIYNFEGRFTGTTGTTPVVITGLSPFTIVAVEGVFSLGVGDSSTFQISTSADGGSTWGGWVNITDNGPYRAIVNMVTGSIDVSSGTWATGSSAANANAIRFRLAAALTSAGNIPPIVNVFTLSRVAP
jgi:hypothetical protein